MENNRFILAALILVFVLTGCATRLAQKPGSRSSTHSNPLAHSSARENFKPTTDRTALQNNEAMTGSASRPVAYEFAQLVLYSDLIIEGQVEQGIETRNERTEDSPDITTDYSIKLTSVLKSEPGFQLDSIVVSQNGGTWDRKTWIMEDDIPYQVGEQVLLFLAKGESSYGALVPGGRFKINDDGTLDALVKEPILDIQKKYHGKSKIELEEAILGSLPTDTDYLATLFPGFLIAEGVIKEAGTRLQADEDSPVVYTAYSFEVTRILYDDLVATKDFSFKSGRFTKNAIARGDVITVLEWGGTSGDLVRPRASPNPMPSGATMLLFLSGFACEERPRLCTPEEQASGHAVYLAGDPGRFVLDTDKKLSSLATRGWIPRIYNGQPLEKLEQDLEQVKAEWAARTVPVQEVPLSTADMPPPPPLD